MRPAVFVSLFTLAGAALQTPMPATGDPQPAVVASSPLAVLTSNDSRVTQPIYRRIASAADWKKIWLSHLGLKQDTIYRPALEIDFDRCVVVAVFRGQSINSSGLRVESVRDVGNAIVVRFDDISYQTAGPDGGADRVTPYAFIVLPKSEKPVVLEENVQSYKGHAAEWKEVARLSSTAKN